MARAAGGGAAEAAVGQKLGYRSDGGRSGQGSYPIRISGTTSRSVSLMAVEAFTCRRSGSGTVE